MGLAEILYKEIELLGIEYVEIDKLPERCNFYK